MKLSPKEKVFLVLKYVCLIFFTILCLYPLFWLLLSSFKTNSELYANPWGLPESFSLVNYIQAIQEGHILQYFGNSVIIAVSAVIVAVILSSMVSYAITRMQWKLAKLTLNVFLLGMMIPVYAMVVPLFSMFNKMGLLNTHLAIIIPHIGIAFPMAIFIMTGFMGSLPKEMEEAAVMDGCNIYQIFFKIIMPISKSSIVTVAVVTFINIWNDLLLPQIFLTDSSKMTLPVGLTEFQGQYATNYVVDRQVGKMKLLIADDEQTIRNGLLSLLWKNIGIEEVYQAENGLAAKEILKAERIDIVISDIKMPGLSGLELAEYIKECSMDTAVIFLTGYSDFEYARRAIRNQVSDYLLKPIRRKDILETVERVLQALERKRYKAEVVRKYETASGSLDLGEQMPWLFQRANRQTMEILQDMAANYAKEISLNSLAEKYHFSAAYLSRMIKKETGYSFSTILNSIRLTAAVKLLEQDNARIHFVCELTGFSDQKYFSQVFKKTLGCSPGEFRRQEREKQHYTIKRILEMTEDRQ